MITDKSDTSEYLLIQGQVVRASASHLFEFLIGRNDGLTFNLNGKLLSRAGTDSSVVLYMRIDSTGVSAKILKKNVDEENNVLL
jgi:hypothetical protein